MNSRASQLFRNIVESEQPAQVILQMIDEQRQEGDYLDFKQGAMADKNAKEHWSEALSGFANTEGGVLIWGVDCRKTPNPNDSNHKIDCACGLSLVPKPQILVELLRKTQLEAVIEPIGGVDIRPIDLNSNGGFVVSYIPEGRHKPYRSTKHNQYFQRIGDSFKVISHPLLRSLFHPVSLARIRLICSFRTGPTKTGEYLYSISFALVNYGQRSANGLLIRVNAPKGWSVEGHEVETLKDKEKEEHGYGHYSVRGKIHPEQTHYFSTCDFICGHVSDKPTADFFVTMYCEDTPKHRFSVKLVNGEIITPMPCYSLS